MSVPNKVKLPIIRRVQLKNFSLYSRQKVISVELSNGVFCLVGANGLGKSTFIATLNFALTGIVPDPKHKFQSVEEYYFDNLKFSSEYFSGRINENDRDVAEVSIEMVVGDKIIAFTRGIFDIEQLREFTVYDIDGKTILNNTADLSPAERNDEFKKIMTECIGLNTFTQYVFLQHFVFTFDESRRLLFWDQKVLEQALYLAFGVNHEQAKKADALRRETEKADSLWRNYGWQATEIQKKIKEIESALTRSTNKDYSELVEYHKKLTLSKDNIEELVNSLEHQLKDTNLALTEVSAKQAVLRNKYSEEFLKYINQNTKLSDHPLVVSSINDCKCGLCGNAGESVVERIKQKINNECPLCGSLIQNNVIETNKIDELRKIDQDIIVLKNKADEIIKTQDRINKELQEARQELYKVEKELQEFENENKETLTKIKHSRENNLDEILEPYRIQLKELLKNRDEQYKRREKNKAELLKLQRQLEKQYVDAEEKFVPLFKTLAYSFIGLDLDIVMETKSRPGITLNLKVKNVSRRQQHTLSESQRFFIDIALRMALTQYITCDSGEACLFIDTPEGSLDIAYESRAGNMFARFIENNYRIIMTANINSSRLLISLGEQCGSDRMKICRMTSWTDLSDVQISEEKLFEQAYKAIEDALTIKEGTKND
ncbi:AAA family ATPase [Effusibacillus lacus]|uniref:Nuclease SbcCD subunit C n=1 Tax=Effusibacillus lacus TaxID=1348429 RepID=A0A292YJ69_9BACL|nr:AAA family ATPase [Effusibacillus lacus]TCS68543.1 hypothetical protein EDD64_14226 [Effusibacillus lacus]GAX88424.1 hypothetical protein EFBL_0033 [Effusibacillus lacus]